MLPEGFPYGAQLERAGVGPIATVPLRQLLAAELARAALARLRPSGGGRLAVAGERLSGELARAVTELALGSRYVLLDVPYGGEALAAQLRREYGVSLLLTADRTQLAEADLLVLFGPRPDLEEGGRAVLRLYDETAPLAGPAAAAGTGGAAAAVLQPGPSFWRRWWRAGPSGRDRSRWDRDRAAPGKIPPRRLTFTEADTIILHYGIIE